MTTAANLNSPKVCQSTPEAYTVLDLQKKFCLSRGTILNLIYSGQLKAEKKEKKWIVTHTELQNYLAQFYS